MHEACMAKTSRQANSALDCHWYSLHVAREYNANDSVQTGYADAPKWL